MRGPLVSLLIAIGIFVVAHVSTNGKMSPSVKNTGIGTVAIAALLYVIFGVF